MIEDRPYAVACLSFMAGAMAGAAAGLLLAPQEGRATRERIGRGVRDARDEARALKDAIVERGEKALNTATETSRRAVKALARHDREPADVPASVSEA
jgi:gas vesicle protein